MDAKTLKHKRGLLKGQLTRFQSFVDKINENKLIEKEITELEARLNLIKPLIEEFDKIQCQIELLPTSSSESTQKDGSSADSVNSDKVDERSVFENHYFSLVAASNRLLALYSRKNKNDSRVVEPVSVQNHNVTTANNNNNIQGVKLPTIELPKFNGSYDQWLEFHDCFNSLIHLNTSLDEIQKFYYLKSCLEKEAADTIKSLEICSKNYSVAWKLLKERFENKKLIIFNHVNAIFDLPNLSKDCNSGQLRQFYDNFTKHLRALEALEQPVDSWDTLLVHLIVKKLDISSRKDWEQFVNNNDSDNIPQMEDMF